MKNNINLDELFSKAKEAEPVFSKDEARTLIENASIASTGSLFNKNIKGSSIMNIMTAAVVTATAVGIIAYNSMTNSQENVTKRTIQIVQNDNIKTKESKLNPELTVADIVNAEQTEKYDKKILVETPKTDSENTNNVNWEKDVIQGVNIIELTEEQAGNIGITIGENADCIQYISGKTKESPELVKIYVDWGVGINQINSNDKKNIAGMFEPRMVTDNFGNKRISTFNEDENSNLSKLEFMDKDKNLYIQSITNKDSDKSVNVVMGGMDKTIIATSSNPNSFDYSNTMNWTQNENKPDEQTRTLDLKDEQIIVTDRKYFYSNPNNNNSMMNFTTVVDVDSLLTNLNIDEIIKNSFSNLDEIKDKLDLPDSLKNRTMEQLMPMLMDSTKKYMNKFSKDFDIKLKMDGNVSEEMKLKLEDLQKKMQGTNIDSLIKSNFQNKMIFMGDNEIRTDKDFKFNNAQIKIVKNISNDSCLNFGDLKINSSSIGDDLIKLNKLVPVAINIPNAKDRNGKELKNFRFVLWFEPTDDFVNKLPGNIKVQLQNELKTLNNSTDICENKDVIAGQETYLDVWRACSGAIENLTSYPNPVENIVNVKFKLSEKRTVNFSIHDLNGRKVQELGKANLTIGTIERSFEVKNLESGMYLIVAQTELGEQAVQRIIVK